MKLTYKRMIKCDERKDNLGAWLTVVSFAILTFDG
jgi:hypothetical protein